MARVTVEDCVERVPNRFELVMLAAQRARNVAAGAALTVDPDNDKNPVIALREIADLTVDLKDLENGLVRSLQKFVEIDEPEAEEMDMLSIQQELGEPLIGEEIAADGLHMEDADGRDIPDDDYRPTSADYGQEAPPQEGEGGG